MSKKKVTNKELLNAIKENNFIVALNAYRAAMRALAENNSDWVAITTRKNSKSDLEFLNKQYESITDSCYGNIVDAVSDLCYLYETNSLTQSGKHAVKSIFKFCMSKKDLIPIIERACNKSKRCSLNNLYKKYKKKVKVN